MYDIIIHNKKRGARVLSLVPLVKAFVLPGWIVETSNAESPTLM